MGDVEAVEVKKESDGVPVQYWYNGNTALGILSNPDKYGVFFTTHITSSPDLESRVYIMEAITGMAPVAADVLGSEDESGKRKRYILKPGRVWRAE